MAFAETDLTTINTLTGGTRTVRGIGAFDERVSGVAVDQAGDIALGTSVLADGTEGVLSATKYVNCYYSRLARAGLINIGTNDVIARTLGGGFVVAETTLNDNYSVHNGHNNSILNYEAPAIPETSRHLGHRST